MRRPFSIPWLGISSLYWSTAARIRTISSRLNGRVGQRVIFGAFRSRAGFSGAHLRFRAKRKNALNRSSFFALERGTVLPFGTKLTHLGQVKSARTCRPHRWAKSSICRFNSLYFLTVESLSLRASISPGIPSHASGVDFLVGWTCGDSRSPIRGLILGSLPIPDLE